MLPIVGDDEPLVRSYLEHFLVDAKDYKTFAPYVNDDYLKHVFAETKIVNGLGDAEEAVFADAAGRVQQLKERIDLDFAFTNKTELAADDPVGARPVREECRHADRQSLRDQHAEFLSPERSTKIGSDINLDGLVANEEKTYTYNEPPLRRVERHFEFPQ